MSKDEFTLFKDQTWLDRWDSNKYIPADDDDFRRASLVPLKKLADLRKFVDELAAGCSDSAVAKRAGQLAKQLHEYSNPPSRREPDNEKTVMERLADELYRELHYRMGANQKEDVVSSFVWDLEKVREELMVFKQPEFWLTINHGGASSHHKLPEPKAPLREGGLIQLPYMGSDALSYTFWRITGVRMSFDERRLTHQVFLSGDLVEVLSL